MGRIHSRLMGICAGCAVTLGIGLAVAQTPDVAPRAANRPVASRPAPAAARPPANLGQLMKGILLPNSNVIFFAQSEDPPR